MVANLHAHDTQKGADVDADDEDEPHPVAPPLLVELPGQPLQLKRHLIETVGHVKGVDVQPIGHVNEDGVHMIGHVTEAVVQLHSQLAHEILNDEHIQVDPIEHLINFTHLGEEGARDTLHISHSNVRVDMNTSPLIYISKLC